MAGRAGMRGQRAEEDVVALRVQGQWTRRHNNKAKARKARRGGVALSGLVRVRRGDTNGEEHGRGGFPETSSSSSVHQQGGSTWGEVIWSVAK